ncbi:FAD-dependent monooxygenase [Nocardia sp. NEAU-G5]|uniref:FAD-dependent monooxygenase n=1 Tax=Nocardia albiluteola TaxID=2842303 RepID=A0ABS6B613_9NOCA|nr:NAD(P)/FAD-dependent oxidoreductase [Nocardia albiluteola]MBU3064780.1 FAD-dependent monooxygenase [Nocardia albiluteola]
MRTDVVVCGAGVAGLATAHALGALGLEVLVVDKQATYTTAAKGEVLQPGALNILRRWGVAPLLEQRGALRLSRLVARDRVGQVRMALNYDQLPGATNWLLAQDHPVILKTLAEDLPGTVQLRWGVLAGGLSRAGDGRVTGVRLRGAETEEQVDARLVVAADGISSRLRKAVDVPANKADYPHRLVALDIHGVDVESDFTAYTTGRGLRLCYPLPGGRVRLYVQTQPDELRGLDDDALVRWADGLVDDLPALAAFGDALPKSLHTRQLLPVSRFLAGTLTAPGLALVGESGHMVHPMAAQGMNSAIVDAHELAVRIGAISARLDPSDVDRALAEYEAARLPNLAHIGQTSHNAARMLTDLSRLGRTLGRRALRHTGANRRLSYTVMHNMSGLGTHRITPLDRLHQIGLLPDPRARRLPAWA